MTLVSEQNAKSGRVVDFRNIIYKTQMKGFPQCLSGKRLGTTLRYLLPDGIMSHRAWALFILSLLTNFY